MDGTEILITSARKHFYYYPISTDGAVEQEIDLNQLHKVVNTEAMKNIVTSPRSKYFANLCEKGVIQVFSAATKHVLFELKMASSSAETGAIVGDYLYTAGDAGKVWKWDLITRRCVEKFDDPGSINTTVMKASPCGQYLATGSYSGVVNIIDISTSLTSEETTRKPLHQV